MGLDKKMIMRQIGAKVAYFRTLIGMSQSDLAEKMNTTQSTISKIERGRYNENLGFVHLIDIAEALDIDLIMLLTFNELEKEMWTKGTKR